MGQAIKVTSAVVVADVVMFDTDRSLSGQDGETYASADAARAGSTFPAELAERLFETDPAIAHVFVYSNVISVKRTKAWDDAAVADSRQVVENFFIVYEENRTG